MFTRVNHMAAIDPQCILLDRCDRLLSGDRSPGCDGAAIPAVIGDGDVGLPILSRRGGDAGAMDLSGMAADEIAKVPGRTAGNNSGANIIERLCCCRLAAGFLRTV